MATSLRDLLAELEDTLSAESSRLAADDAVAALDHLGRALTRLAEDGFPARAAAGRETAAVAELARGCRAAAAAWAGLPRARATDLAGATADLLDWIRGELGGNERWAAASELATAARRCIGLAERHPPYADVPPLARVRRLAATVEQLATDPPRPERMVALDRLIPVAGLPAGLPRTRIAAESAAVVADQLRRAADDPTRRPLRLVEVMAVLRAAEATAQYSSALATALDPITAHRPEAQATAGWRAVRRALDRFDDGTRHRRGVSLVIVWAVRQHEGLRHELGPAAELDLAQLRDLPNLPRVLTDLRVTVNQLPGIATSLQAILGQWAQRGHLAARAGDLDIREERAAAIVADAPIPVDTVDLADPLDALHGARLLSTALAAQLDHAAGDVGTHPQRHLSAAYTAALASPAVAQELAHRARLLRLSTPATIRRELPCTPQRHAPRP